MYSVLYHRRFFFNLVQLEEHTSITTAREIKFRRSIRIVGKIFFLFERQTKFCWYQSRNSIALQSGIRLMINGDKWCKFFSLSFSPRHGQKQISSLLMPRIRWHGCEYLYAFHPRYSAVIYAQWEESNVTWLIERIAVTNIISADVSTACINNINCLSRCWSQSKNFSLLSSSTKLQSET